MGLLLFVGVQFALYGVLWWLVSLAHPDSRSYLIGALHLIAIAAVAIGLPRIYFHLRGHGWTADVVDWCHRCQAQFSTDWKRSDAGSWDVDFFRLQVVRSHERGSLSICVALLGLHWHGGVLVSVTERQAFIAAQLEKREAYFASLPAEVQEQARDMLKNVPLDAHIEGAVQLVTQPDTGDDDDDDDDDKEGEQVH